MSGSAGRLVAAGLASRQPAGAKIAPASPAVNRLPTIDGAASSQPVPVHSGPGPVVDRPLARQAAAGAFGLPSGPSYPRGVEY